MSRRMQHYVRALGWSAFAAAPPLLVALAVVSSRPSAPASLVTTSAVAAWIAGTLAFGASMVWQRGGHRVARVVGGLAALVAVAVCGALVWAAVVLGVPVATLETHERAELELRSAEDGERIVHPHLGFSVPALPTGMQRTETVRDAAERTGGPGWAEAHRVWAWEGLESEVVVDLARVPRADPETLARVAEEVAAGFESAGAPEPVGAQAVRLEARVAQGGHALTRVLLFTEGDRAYRLLVTVVTRDRPRWEPWLEGVHVPSAGS